MKASVPLLEFAVPKAGELSGYYKKHLEEEKGHDLMLQEDLKALGVDPIPLYFDSAQIAGSQYYLIAHEHPALLLGYMIALESNAPKMPLIVALEQRYGVTLTCMRHHAKHDPHHYQDLKDVIAALPAELQERIWWNCKHTIGAWVNVMDKYKEAA